MTSERAKRFPLGLADLERKPRAAGAEPRTRADERARPRESLAARESAGRRIDTYASYTADKMGAPNVPLAGTLPT